MIECDCWFDTNEDDDDDDDDDDVFCLQVGKAFWWSLLCCGKWTIYAPAKLYTERLTQLSCIIPLNDTYIYIHTNI